MEKIRSLPLLVGAYIPFNEELCFPITHEVMENLADYQTEGITISEGMLCFKNLATKSQKIAAYYYNSLPDNNEISFFNKAIELQSESSEYDALSVVEEYISLGSASRDIFLAAKIYLESNEENFAIFRILHVLAQAMNKQFSYNSETFLDFFIFVYEKIEMDLATSNYIAKFSNFLFTNEQHCLEIYSLCSKSSNRFLAPIYNNIVMKFYKKFTYMKIELCNSLQKDLSVSPNKIYLYGQVLLEDKIHTGSEITNLLTLAENGSDDQKHSAFSALVLHLGKSQEIDRIFTEKVLNKNIWSIISLVRKLSSSWSNFISHPNFTVWFQSTAHIPAGMKGVEESRDFLFSEVISENYALVVSCIELCIHFYEEHNKPFNIEELFPSTLRELIKNDQFGTQLLLWFNRKQHNIAHISAEIISFSSINKCTFSNFDIDILHIKDPEDLLSLCRGILGYVTEVDFLLPVFTALACFYKDSSLLYIVTQCIEITAFDYPPQAMQALEYFQNNYPGTKLDEKANAIKANINNYFDSLKKLPKINELHPSRSEENVFHIEQNKNMSRHFQAAQKQSVILSVASTVTLKAGKAFFSCRDELPDKPTPLTPIETFFTLPRSILLDPVKYEFDRLVFRLQHEGKL